MASQECLDFDTISQETELYDKWLFTSTSRYRYVNMYELEKATQAAIWFERITSPCICLATSELTQNELLVYELPQVREDEEAHLSKDREMKIVAASACSGPTTRISLLPESFSKKNQIGRTQVGSSDITLHQLPASIDSSSIADINQVDCFSLYSEGAYPLVSPTFLFHDTSHLTAAQTVDNIKSCDLNTKHTVSDYSTTSSSAKPDTSVSDIVCNSSGSMGSTLLLCTRHGDLLTLDTRQRSYSTSYSPSASESSTSTRWRMCYWRDHQLLLVDDSSRLSVIDTRQPKSSVYDLQLEAPPWIGRLGNSHHFSIATNGNFLSVSGKDNKLRIYDLKLSGDNSKPVQPAFVHDGHLPTWDCADMPVITTHSWRTKSDGILSATNTGQIHTWMFE